MQSCLCRIKHKNIDNDNTCIIRGFHGGEIEVVDLWVAVPCNLLIGNQRFGHRATFIFRVDFRIHEDVSTSMLLTEKGSRRRMEVMEAAPPSKLWFPTT
jgi:hypothetical protein